MTYAHRPRALPGFVPIARQQLWFFIASIQRLWPFMIMAAALPVFFATLYGSFPSSRLFLSVLLALFLTVLAWPQEKTTGGIAYFRSLPPVYWKNASVRTSVVWIILMILCLTTFLAIGSGYRDAGVFWNSAPALVGATFIFLVLSGLFAATRYGILWLIGAQMVLNLGRRNAGSGAAELFEPLIMGRLGAFAATTGRMEGPISDTAGTGHVVDPTTWLLASALWLAVGIAIFLFATSRRREY